MAEQTINAQSSAKFVTVGLKHPSGIILHIDELRKTAEPILGGGQREFTLAAALPTKITLSGNAFDPSKPKVIVTAGGYALTPNVPKDFFDKWLSQNSDSDLVRNRLIYAEERQDYADKRGREQAELKSGMEPLDPVKDPRSPRGIEKMDAKSA